MLTASRYGSILLLTNFSGGRRMAKTYKPGERVPASAQVEIVGPRGGRTGEERTVTRGEKFPPTPERGQG